MRVSDTSVVDAARHARRGHPSREDGGPAGPSRSPNRRAAPSRRCAGCRAVAPADALVRLVLEADGWVGVDPDRTRGGRGVHIEPTRACLDAAIKRRALARGFRRSPARASLEGLAERIAAAYAERLVAYLTDARRRTPSAVASAKGLSEVSPPALGALIAAAEAAPGRLVEVPMVTVRDPKMARKVAHLARVVSEFTFTRAGVKKRRPRTRRAPDSQHAGDKTTRSHE